MYKRILILSFLILSLTVTGCATPPQVKQLSLKQMEYFDAAIKAVALQSEALILAAEKLKSQAEEKISANEQKNRSRFEKFATETIPKLPDEEKSEATKKMLSEVAETSKVADVARTKLNNDIKIIKNKTEELQLYLKKMKEVHLALDAYIQSEKAGERVINDVLKHPSVNSLLSTANELIPKVQNGIQEIQTLLKGI